MSGRDIIAGSRLTSGATDSFARQLAVATLKALLLIGAVVYLGIVALMYFAQRSLMYFPETRRTAPEKAGLREAEEVVLDTADGERVIVWHIPPRGDRPVVLYFHGNGGALRYRVDRYRALTEDGTGLVLLSYRGYGGSSGRPSEDGLIEDARAAYAFATQHHPSAKLVIWGESLGSGVAVAIAAEKAGEKNVARVVLEAPFASAVSVAASVYPFVPVRFLMKDQFRSDLRIRNVKVPVLIVHGDRDAVIPIESGERLYSLIEGPKHCLRVPGAGHEDLGPHAIEAMRAFVAERFD
jgi:fermentation-respiration switch protein FrsA (DUF1100 family)